MDYKAMWEELKERINNDLEYYEDGRMCSMAEQFNGISNCEAMIIRMKSLEEKYGT